MQDYFVHKDTEKRLNNKRSWEFEVNEQGWRYHMSEIMAAIGRVQLSRFKSLQKEELSLQKIIKKHLI